jgi:type II secretory pathway component PulF
MAAGQESIKQELPKLSDIIIAIVEFAKVALTIAAIIAAVTVVIWWGGK